VAAKGKKSRKKKNKKARRKKARSGGQKAAAAEKSGAKSGRAPRLGALVENPDQKPGEGSEGTTVVTADVPDAVISGEPESEARLAKGGPEQPEEPQTHAGASGEGQDASDRALDMFDLDAAVQETSVELGDDVTVDELIAQVGASPEGASHEPVGEPASTGTIPRGPDAGVTPSPASDAVAGQVDTDDADSPVSVGPPSTAEDRARLLAAASAYAEMQDARYRVPTDSPRVARLKGWIALTGFLIAALVAIAPPELVSPAPPNTLTEADRLHGLYVGLLLQAEQVEAFRTREHRLPDSLAEVAARVPGVRFVRSGNRVYQLIAYTGDGRAIVYDSAVPAAEFETVQRAWASAMGS
jgi:hypothetical protein